MLENLSASFPRGTKYPQKSALNDSEFSGECYYEKWYVGGARAENGYDRGLMTR